jgi:hypothetical protein
MPLLREVESSSFITRESFSTNIALTPAWLGFGDPLSPITPTPAQVQAVPSTAVHDRPRMPIVDDDHTSAPVNAVSPEPASTSTSRPLPSPPRELARRPRRRTPTIDFEAGP